MNKAQSWQERFDNKFNWIVESSPIMSKEKNEDGLFEKSELDDIKDFIAKELTLARQEEREKVRKEIQKLRTVGTTADTFARKTEVEVCNSTIDEIEYIIQSL